MFGIGPEFLVIVIVALVVLGPAQLPGLLKTFGKGINEFRRMSADVKSTLEREITRAEELKRVEEIRKELFDDQPLATELEQEAAEEAAKREAESVNPAEDAQAEIVEPAGGAETAESHARAEALKLMDAAKAEAARLVANAQAEANKLLEAAEAAKAAENSGVQAAKPAEPAKTDTTGSQAQASTLGDAAPGKDHA